MNEEKTGFKPTLKDIAYYVIMVLLFLLFLFASAFFISRLVSDKKQNNHFNDLAAMLPARNPSPSVKENDNPNGSLMDDGGELDEEDDYEDEEEWQNQKEQKAMKDERLLAYQSLKEMNKDLVGWISIPETKINYPVVQNVKNPEFYMDKNFYKENSSYGVPFLDGDCDIEDTERGLVIYGHHMKNGAMFADLANYKDRDFCWQHPVIYFDTVKELGEYHVIAVLYIGEEKEDALWWQLLNSYDQEEFKEIWNKVEKQSLYPMGVTPKYGNRLLALITCEYMGDNGRILVLAEQF